MSECYTDHISECYTDHISECYTGHISQCYTGRILECYSCHISECYTGRILECYTGHISDKARTKESGCLDELPSYCSIMADKGFNLFDEGTARNIHFIIYTPR